MDESNSLLCHFEYIDKITAEFAKDYLIRALFEGKTILLDRNGVEQKIPNTSIKYDKNVYCYKDGIDFPSDVIGVNYLGEAVFAIQLYSPQRDHTLQSTVMPVFVMDTTDIVYNFDLLTLYTIKLHYYNVFGLIPLGESILTRAMNIAVKMGFLKIDKAYNCRAQCLLDQVEKGFYFLDKKIWKPKGIPDPYLYKCFSCFASTKKGLCDVCCVDIIRKNKKPRKKVYASSDIVALLRFSLGWLNFIKGDYQLGDPCFICNRKYITEEENRGLEHFWDNDKKCVPGYTTWYDDNKCCCLICIHLSLKMQKILI